MDGVLAALGPRYVGILNGIDTDVWNPATDPWLPAHSTSTICPARLPASARSSNASGFRSATT